MATVQLETPSIGAPQLQRFPCGQEPANNLQLTRLNTHTPASDLLGCMHHKPQHYHCFTTLRRCSGSTCPTNSPQPRRYVAVYSHFPARAEAAPLPHARLPVHKNGCMQLTNHMMIMIHDSVQAQEQQSIQGHPTHTAVHPHTTADIAS
jgi:hypothetical protein